MAEFLLVDDSVVARTFLKRALERQGHIVVGEAANGLEGYDMYLLLKPDFVTIDMTMPVMNGMDCLKRIMADFPDAKAVIVSSVAKRSHREEALALGAIQYVQKPTDDNEVKKILDLL